MPIYACINDDDVIVAQITIAGPEDGIGPVYLPMADEYQNIRIVPTLIRRTKDLSDTSLLHWNEGNPEFRETLPLGDFKDHCLKEIDALADTVRARILVAPTNTVEYSLTETQAREYQESGYQGTVPPAVASWAYAKRRKGWTAEQATEDIITTADAWKNLLWFIRAKRLDTKELVRDADSVYQIELLLETFKDGLAAATAGL
jgi:hypothetical protein